MTQKQQIKKAKYAYLFDIAPQSKSIHYRFAVYLDYKDGSSLDVLWPSGAPEDPLLPLQVYSKRESYPAYHFHCDNEHQLAATLTKINPTIVVMRQFSGKFVRPIEVAA